MIIAIDGRAASGKGTLARNLAKKLNYAYLDTGALYRTVAKISLDEKITPLAAALKLQKIVTPELLADPEIRTDVIGQAAASVADDKEVRKALFKLQRDFATNPPKPFKGSILDGRDIGTVICPDADHKLFIIADPEVRAKRRTKELLSRNVSTTYEAVLKDMRERDARDEGRKAAPLKPAEDAVVLDTTHLSESEVLEKALEIIQG
jgi:cytidylate kinase